MIETDVLIVGAGIAGASLAAAIGQRQRIVIVEAEDAPGRHSTGRSAAFYDETYGGPGVQPLTTASGPLLRHPGEAMGGCSFLRPRGGLILGRKDQHHLLDAMLAEFAGSDVRIDTASRTELDCRLAGLRPEWDAGLLLPDCEDIDVAALHQAVLRLARRNGASVVTRAPLIAASRRSDGRWQAECGNQTIVAGIIVNAAGAWADEVAKIVDAKPMGIRPYRRTIAQVRLGVATPASMPLVIDAAGSFYFKGEGPGRIWLSPHDETPDEASDVAADELDVAIAIDRLQQVVDWPVEAVERRWAGLRSFAPDRLPVYGYAPETPGFFWCAGQGGFGIQTAPAAAMLAAALLCDEPADSPIAGIDCSPFLPSRF